MRGGHQLGFAAVVGANDDLALCAERAGARKGGDLAIFKKMRDALG